MTQQIKEEKGKRKKKKKGKEHKHEHGAFKTFGLKVKSEMQWEHRHTTFQPSASLVHFKSCFTCNSLIIWMLAFLSCYVYIYSAKPTKYHLKFDLIWIGLDWIVGVFSTIHHPSIVRLSGVWLFENEFRIKLYNSRCLYLFINYLLRVCLGKQSCELKGVSGNWWLICCEVF